MILTPLKKFNSLKDNQLTKYSVFQQHLNYFNIFQAITFQIPARRVKHQSDVILIFKICPFLWHDSQWRSKVYLLATDLWSTNRNVNQRCEPSSNQLNRHVVSDSSICSMLTLQASNLSTRSRAIDSQAATQVLPCIVISIRKTQFLRHLLTDYENITVHVFYRSHASTCRGMFTLN